jgi:hypothetical protein
MLRRALVLFKVDNAVHGFGNVNRHFHLPLEVQDMPWFDMIRSLPSIDCEKRDRRGWVVIKHATEQLSLFF